MPRWYPDQMTLWKSIRSPACRRVRRVPRAARILAAWLMLAVMGHAAELKDQFDDREQLTANSGAITGSNAGATRETDEPQHADKPGGRSVWISWIAPTNGIMTIRTSGSTFDTLLAAYYFRDGDEQTLDKLREAASNDDDAGTEPASFIQFATKAGRRYEIAVDGYQGATGAVALSWNFIDINTQPPIVVSVPGDRAARLGDPVTLTVNFETSPDARLQWRFNGDSFGEEGPTLFIPSLQLTNVGRYSLRVRIGDNRFETTPVEIQINSEGQTNALARDKVFDALGSRLTPNDDADDADDADDDGEPAGAAPLLVAASAPVLAASAGVSRGHNGTQVFNTTYATPDPNEPQHCGVAGGASYWFAYEAPMNGVLRVDTIGSGYDTLLAAYGVQLPVAGYDSLVPLACDNDAVAPLGESRIEFPVLAGRQYLVVLDGVAGARGIAHLNYQLEVAPPPDTTKPVLTVTAPAARLMVVSNAPFTIAGVAGDNVGVSNVVIETREGASLPASGTSQWSAGVELLPGTNVFTVTAMDAAGNVSAVVTRTVVYVTFSRLTLAVVGNGSVTGAADQQSLVVGRSYSLVARPAKGHVFRGWSGDIAGLADRIDFLMRSNLAVTATFIPNPFAGVAGTFVGCFHRSNNIALDSSGLVTVTLRSSGSFSGVVQQPQRRLPLAGRFDPDGRATVSIPRKGTNALLLTMALPFEDGGSIVGVVSDGAWSTTNVIEKAGFHPRRHPATNYAGRYTMLIPGAEDADSAPVGDGIAAVTVAMSGSTTVAGHLADGTAFARRVALASSGRASLFAPLYRGRGMVVGAVNLRPIPDPGSDVSGDVYWLRLAGTRPPTDTNGFLLSSAITGSAFASPAVANLPGLSGARMIFDLPAGALQVTNPIAFGPGTRVTNHGRRAMTLALASGSGLFSGRVALSEDGPATSFRGALLQRQQMGGGYFVLSNQVGRVSLMP